MKLFELFEKVKDYTYYHQQKDYTCGVAGLRGILKYFGVSPPKEDKLAQVCSSDPEEGTLPGNIVKVLRRFGLNATHGHLEVDELVDLIKRGKPVLLLYQHGDVKGEVEGHYATALEVTEDGVVVYDPYYHQKDLLTWDKLEHDWWSFFSINNEYYRNWGIYIK